MTLEEDLMYMHRTVSEHVPEVMVTYYKGSGVDIDIKKAVVKMQSIFEEHFKDTDALESTFIAQLLIREIYRGIEQEMTRKVKRSDDESLRGYI